MRIVHMGGVDLDLFQFDWDMTWAAFFMNADRTIYGRYGSRRAVAKRSDELLAISSLKNAMRLALEVHANYPANRESLARKRGPALPWNRPHKIPSLPDPAKRARPPRTCVHCHHVAAGMRRSLVDQKRLLTDEQVWVYPFPDNIGLRIDVGDGRRVAGVVAGSPAAKAGVKVDDVVETLDGQPILSIADIQWVLHRSPRKTELKAGVLRAGKKEALAIPLDGAWRETDISWRLSTWSIRPGLRFEELTGAERARLEIAGDAMALRVLRVPRNHVNKQRGFKANDVFVEVGGRNDRLTESQLIAFLRQTYKAGSRVAVRLLRKGRKTRMVLRVG